jgi:two-component system nitrogen regulation sensor histidine kinase GlnL
LKNACEASENSNKIKIKTVYNLGSRLTISESNLDQLSMLGVVVINHGKGIPDAIKTRLFDPFVTTKADGTGLGLALVASIITDHGGSVEVNDNDGKTAFQINLPITRGMA